MFSPLAPIIMFLFGFVLTLFVWLSYADWTSVPCTSPRWSTTGEMSWIAGDSTCGSTQLLSVDPDTGAQIELMFNGDGLQLCGGMDGDATAQIFLDNVKHENSIQTSGGPQCTYLATWLGLSPNTGHNLTIVVPSYPPMGYPTASGTGMGFALDRALISTPDDEPDSSSVTTPVSTVIPSVPTMSPATPASVAPATSTTSASSAASQHTSSAGTVTSTSSSTVAASSAKYLATPATSTSASSISTLGDPALGRQPSHSHPVSKGAIIGASIASGILLIILVTLSIWLARRYRSKGQPIVYEWTPGQTSETPTARRKASLSEKGQPQPEASTTATPSNANVAQGENVHIWTALARLQGEVHALRGGNEEPVPSYVSSPGTHRIQ